MTILTAMPEIAILKDSKIEITPIFQIEDANSASHPPVVQIEDIHVARVVFQGVSRDSWSDLMTIFYSSPQENCKKTQGKVNLLFIVNSGCCRSSSESMQLRATYATNTVWGVPDQKMQKHLVKVVFAGLLPFEDFRMKPCKDGRNFR